jgi:hypothetical protein
VSALILVLESCWYVAMNDLRITPENTGTFNDVNQWRVWSAITWELNVAMRKHNINNFIK